MSGGGKLADLIRRLDVIQTSAWKADLSRKLAGVSIGLLQDGFDQASTPYGDRWKPRKHDKPWPLLNRTGKLRAWRLAAADAGGFRLEPAAPYASYLHYGTKYMAPREMVPVEAFGLGKWRDEYERVVVESLKDVMRGR